MARRTLDRLERIQQAHHLRLIGVQEATGELVAQTWDRHAGLNDEALAAFSNAAATVVDVAKSQIGTLANGYMLANDRLGGFPRVDLPTGLPQIRHGTPTSEVYARSIIEARRRISTGAEFDQAMSAGRARAIGTAKTDVILANKAAMAAGGDLRPWVVGYRRVLTGKSCAFCATASTQRYRTADLMPIHARCDCDVAEIYGTADPGRVINQDLLDNLKAAAGEDGRPDYWNGPYLVDESGTIRYRKIETIDGPDGKIRRTTAGDPVRPEIVEHGEIGPTLTDARHATTTISDSARLTATRGTGNVTPRIRANVTDPDVIAEANRRNVTPERVIELRTEKAERRILEQRARREAERSLSADSPDVVAVAKRYGVHPDEVLVARERVADIRALAREAAARVQADAMAELERLGVGQLRNPPRTRPGGEWDWLEQVDARERARLSRNWYASNGDAPDQMALRMSAALERDVDVDEAIDIWLDLTRRAEAAGALRRGKLPSSNAYSGQIDADDLLQQFTDEEGFEISRLFGDDLNAAGHIAQADAALVADDAFRLLGPSTNPVEGPAPYRMSFIAWHDELRALEDRVAEGIATTVDRRRILELVPELVDEPGLEFEDLYARIISTARKAGEEVPSHAAIPW